MKIKIRPEITVEDLKRLCIIPRPAQILTLLTEEIDVIEVRERDGRKILILGEPLDPDLCIWIWGDYAEVLNEKNT